MVVVVVVVVGVGGVTDCTFGLAFLDFDALFAFSLGPLSTRLDFNPFMATRPGICIQSVTEGASGGAGTWYVELRVSVDPCDGSALRGWGFGH